ncbi:MAG: hypothetical protein [Circular genetic element sp.]|nr:MAG: hypothetical protein [Circular genetic element sp.]
MEEAKMNFKEWFKTTYIDKLDEDQIAWSPFCLHGEIRWDWVDERLFGKHYKAYLRGPQEKKFAFITINDMKQGPESFNKLIEFGKSTEYLYDDVVWWIESGKYEDNPHFHYHALGRINAKDLKGRMAPKWNKLFGTNLKGKDAANKPIYKCKRHNDAKPGSEKMPPYEQWWNEKIDYIINDNKGTHENYCDLTKSGGLGVAGVFTSIVTPH